MDVKLSNKWTYRLFGHNYRVAALSTFLYFLSNLTALSNIKKLKCFMKYVKGLPNVYLYEFKQLLR